MSLFPKLNLKLSSDCVNVNEPSLALDVRTDEERALLKRIGRGDHAALDELYQAYAGPIFSYAYKMLSRHEDAEEVLQDVFVRIWKKAKYYDGTRSKPFTWSIMITRGLALDRLRKRNKKSALRTLPIDEVEEPCTQNDECITHLFFDEASRQVETALRTLPDEERRCLELVIFSEIT